MDRKKAAESKISIREVSRLSGVSIATVSRVIHNNGRFSEETAKRVLKVMEELNYTPDALAQGMRRRAMAVVGIIVPDILDDRFGLLVRIVQEKLFENGYSTVVFNSNDNGNQSQRFIDTLISTHVSGLIYVPDSQNTEIDLKGLPTVFFERTAKHAPETPNAHIIMNDFEASKKAMERLLEKKPGKVLILGDSLGISSYQKRMEGAISAFENRQNLSCGYLLKKMEPQRTKATISAIEEIFMQECAFDAIFSVSIRMTIGALKVLKEKNLQNQVTVVGIGEHRLHEYGLLEYFAIREPIEEMAYSAAETIMKLIGGEEIKEQLFEMDDSLLQKL